MATDSPLRLALTMGDPNGIGPELVLTCMHDVASTARSSSGTAPATSLAVIGTREVLEYHARQLELGGIPISSVSSWDEVRRDRLNVFEIESHGDTYVVSPGELSEEAGRLAMRSVEQVTDMCISGEADGMITAPFSKEAVQLAGYRIPGHTEFIAERSGADRVVMMMVAGALRIGLVTAHVSLAEVPAAITRAAIIDRLSVMYRTLQTDFGVAEPRIAVLGLNPHASDGGMMGREEIDVIGPAIDAFNEESQRAVGPFAADGFFGLRRDKQFDAVLCMYHDQGLAPFKALSFDSGVNFTAGLPIVRTSPVHGTAFDIAGQGKARPGSMTAAIQLAAEVAARRRQASFRRGQSPTHRD